MFAIVFLRRGEDGEPRVAKYGPTSDDPTLLEEHDCSGPDDYDVRAILWAGSGFMLSVSRRGADEALKAAGY